MNIKDQLEDVKVGPESFKILKEEYPLFHEYEKFYKDFLKAKKEADHEFFSDLEKAHEKYVKTIRFHLGAFK